MSAVTKLADARKERDRKRYAELVMSKFLEAEHADKRKLLDRKSEVQIAAREKL